LQELYAFYPTSDLYLRPVLGEPSIDFVFYSRSTRKPLPLVLVLAEFSKPPHLSPDFGRLRSSRPAQAAHLGHDRGIGSASQHAGPSCGHTTGGEGRAASGSSSRRRREAREAAAATAAAARLAREAELRRRCMTIEIKGIIYWQDSDAARAAFHSAFDIPDDDDEYLPDDGACPGTDFDHTDSYLQLSAVCEDLAEGVGA